MQRDLWRNSGIIIWRSKKIYEAFRLWYRVFLYLSRLFLHKIAKIFFWKKTVSSRRWKKPFALRLMWILIAIQLHRCDWSDISGDISMESEDYTLNRLHRWERFVRTSDREYYRGGYARALLSIFLAINLSRIGSIKSQKSRIWRYFMCLESIYGETFRCGALR